VFFLAAAADLMMMMMMMFCCRFQDRIFLVEISAQETGHYFSF